MDILSHRNSEGQNFHWDIHFRQIFAWDTSKFRLGQEFEREILTGTKFGSKVDWDAILRRKIDWDKISWGKVDWDNNLRKIFGLDKV